MAKKIASLYAEIGGDVKPLTGALAETKTGLAATGDKFEKFSRSTAMAFTEMSSAIGLVKEGYGVAATVYDMLITQNVDYALSIQQMSRELSISAEEASRLVQAADDFGVSQTAVEGALKIALKNGFVPTIENMAILADQYNSIKDPIERAALMTEKFGRSWEEIEPMLKDGAQAIRDAGAAADETGKVLDEKAVANAERYRVAMDRLSDAQGKFVAEVGMKFVPTIATMVEFMGTLAEKTNESGTMWMNVIPILGNVKTVVLGIASAFELWTKAANEASKASQNANSRVSLAQLNGNFEGRDHANGGSFIIPSGFMNDSFPLGGGHMAQSGERVSVTPAGQTSNELSDIAREMRNMPKAIARSIRDAILMTKD